MVLLSIGDLWKILHSGNVGCGMTVISSMLIIDIEKYILSLVKKKHY